jgi:hypothetical protein
MNFLRNHWPDVGLLLAVLLGIWLLFSYTALSVLQIILWLSFISLLLHQTEEYRFPGYFPRFMNASIFRSKELNRYPLNTNTALVVNVFFGWTMYILAAIFAERAIWLAIICIMVNVGNILAHVVIFNIRARTFYNPGMGTSLVLFLPVSILFFWYVVTNNLADTTTILLWVPIGFVVAIILTLGAVEVLKNPHTSFRFSKGI